MLYNHLKLIKNVNNFYSNVQLNQGVDVCKEWNVQMLKLRKPVSLINGMKNVFGMENLVVNHFVKMLHKLIQQIKNVNKFKLYVFLMEKVVFLIMLVD
jgi:hypothetical protein